MKRITSLLVTATAALFVAACSTTPAIDSASAPVNSSVRTPLPAIHPLIGAWRLDLKSVNCHEVYHFRADGTAMVTSAEQVSETEFTIDLLPGASGFYKWVDKITKDNGKPDCMGSIMQVGHVATNYVLLHSSKKAFFLCQKEDTSSCIGPLVRQ